MPETVVSNASPLIALQATGRLELLTGLFGGILIPPAVQLEVAPSLPELPSWVTVRAVPPAPRGPGPARLGPGESEAIALALHVGAVVLMDELAGRRQARALGLRVTGTIGVLLEARHAGLIQAVRPELDALVRTGFFISAGLYRMALRDAGEPEVDPA